MYRFKFNKAHLLSPCSSIPLRRFTAQRDNLVSRKGKSVGRAAPPALLRSTAFSPPPAAKKDQTCGLIGEPPALPRQTCGLPGRETHLFLIFRLFFRAFLRRFPKSVDIGSSERTVVKAVAGSCGFAPKHSSVVGTDIAVKTDVLKCLDNFVHIK